MEQHEATTTVSGPAYKVVQMPKEGPCRICGQNIPAGETAYAVHRRPVCSACRQLIVQHATPPAMPAAAQPAQPSIELDAPHASPAWSQPAGAYASPQPFASPAGFAPPPQYAPGPAEYSAFPNPTALLGDIAAPWPAGRAVLGWIGVGAAGFLAISVLLPWFSLGFFGSVSIIRSWQGAALLVLALGTGGFATFTLIANRVFVPAAAAGAALGLASAIFCVTFLIRFGSLASAGAYFGLIASLAAAGAFGFPLIESSFRAAPKRLVAPAIAIGSGLILGLLLALTLSGRGSSSMNSRYTGPSSADLDRAQRDFERALREAAR